MLSVHGIVDMGHSWAAWFIDPSGNVLAVVEPQARASPDRRRRPHSSPASASQFAEYRLR
ncbi:MAG: VOC family protein [Actinomycetota bacterium]